ncbi:MAG: hypothetical protein HGA78_11735 [Nitrospirales bacterium]|nr:hypothetical protein [Nitrospirales bacterium]
MAKRYTLYGTIDLTYERDWTEGSPFPAVNTFSQNYDLGVRGFVVDPRLVSFDVAGVFSRATSDNGLDYTLAGMRLNAIFLEDLPRAGGKVLKYLPNPIRLRFVDYTNAYEYKNYGVSLQYAVPKEILFYKKAEEGGGSKFDVPLLFFDYDKYKYSGQNYHLTTDVYSLRASMTGEHYDHRFSYEKEEQSGTTRYKRETFELLPQYRFYDEKTRRSIDIFNSLRFERIDDRRSLSIQVAPRYYEPREKDVRLVTGNFGYSRISSPEQKTESYDSSVSASYTKVISPRFTNTTSLAVGFTKSGGELLHFERAGNSVQTDISRIVGASGSVSVGNSSRGVEYGLEGNVYTKTRVRTTAGYAFSSIPDDTGRTTTNRIYLTATGPVLKMASFDMTAQYIANDVSGVVGGGQCNGTGHCNTFEEDLLFFSTNVYWYVGKTALTFGGSYANTVSRTDHRNSSSFTFLYANASRYLTPRTFLNLYSTWQQGDDDVQKLEVRPSVTWRRGLTLVDLEYDYTRTSRGDDGVEPTGDHRVMLRFIRNIYQNIY